MKAQMRAQNRKRGTFACLLGAVVLCASVFAEESAPVEQPKEESAPVEQPKEEESAPVETPETATTANPSEKLLKQVWGGYAVFFPDDTRHSIPLENIFPGAPIDMIPALTRPKMIAADEAAYLNDGEAVLGIEINGDARAFPLRVMRWHEIVNDIIGEIPAAVTYCPLCGTSIAFDSRLDGKMTRFGVSGLLHNSDLLMYNRGADIPSLWQQALGKAVAGPLTGTQLEFLPVTHTSWGDWKARRPHTTVLSLETGHQRDYGMNPYKDYEQEKQPYFPISNLRHDMPLKTWVYGVVVHGRARAYPMAQLKTKRLTHDKLGETNLLLIVGSGDLPNARAYLRGAHSFHFKDGSLTDEKGGVWEMTEAALKGPDGEELPRIGSAFASYWFAWSAFYPHTDIHNSERNSEAP